MLRTKIAALVISLIGALVFFRDYYMVSFAVGYGIREADRNQRLFLGGAIICTLVFLGSAGSICLRRKGNH